MTRQVFTRDVKMDQIKGAIAFAMGGDAESAAIWAEKRWGKDGRPYEINKAVGVLSDEDTGGNRLIDTAIFSAVRERAVLFRMRGVRRTGFNIRSLSVAGTVANWVGEGAPLPFTKPVFDSSGLDAFKLAGGTVATMEALQNGPAIETTLYEELVRAVTDEVDASLLDPSNAGVADVAPPSITNGISPVDASGNPDGDIANLIADFSGDLRSAYFTMHPTTAAKLAALNIGRDLGVRGGELLGAPVLTSATAPTTSIALIDPTGLLMAHDDDVLLTSSQSGAVEVAASPTQDGLTPTGAELLSLFQQNLWGFKALLHASWKRATDDAVSVLQGGASDWLA